MNKYQRYGSVLLAIMLPLYSVCTILLGYTHNGIFQYMWVMWFILSALLFVVIPVTVLVNLGLYLKRRAWKKHKLSLDLSIMFLPLIILILWMGVNNKYLYWEKKLFFKMNSTQYIKDKNDFIDRVNQRKKVDDFRYFRNRFPAYKAFYFAPHLKNGRTYIFVRYLVNPDFRAGGYFYFSGDSTTLKKLNLMNEEYYYSHELGNGWYYWRYTK